MDEMDGFLATVDEYVDDEERIVTCKWLSQQLAVPVNKSREILRRYLDSCKKHGNGIHAVYMIIGRTPSGLCIKVVRDNDLESAKSKLCQVISTSLYSVQKVVLPNSGMLYSSDFDGNRKNLGENCKLGGIVYNGAIKLTKDEIEKQKGAPTGTKEASLAMEQQFAKPSSEKNKASQQKINFFGKAKTSPPKKKIETVPPEKPQTTASDLKKSDQSVKSKTQKKGGVAAFLTKGKTDPFATVQNTKKVKEEHQESENEPQNGPKIQEKGTLSPKKSSLNEKHDNNAKKSSQRVEEKTLKQVKKEPQRATSSSKRSLEEDELKIDNFSDDDNDFASKSSENDSQKVTKKPEPTKTASKNDQKSQNDSKKVTKKTEIKTGKSKKTGRKEPSVQPMKKRRRIQEMSSSSEDESDEDDFREEMDIIPPSPPPQASKPDKGIPPEEGHKTMKKVFKSKTFIDDEGSMVTEKSYEFEECDEPEQVTNGDGSEPKQKASEPEPKKTKFPTTSTAAQPKKHTKQASIMGFFSKK